LSCKKHDKYMNIRELNSLELWTFVEKNIDHLTIVKESICQFNDTLIPE